MVNSGLKFHFLLNRSSSVSVINIENILEIVKICPRVSWERLSCVRFVIKELAGINLSIRVKI